MTVLYQEEYEVKIDPGTSIDVAYVDMNGDYVSVETVPDNPSIKVYLHSAVSGASLFQGSGAGFFGPPGTVLMWPRFKISAENTSTNVWTGKIVVKIARR